MKKMIFLFLVTLALLPARSTAQQPATIQEYINTFKDIAIAEEQRTGVPAAIKIAQGIHETSAGTSLLVKKSNNHFGIKCKTGWNGPSVSHTDDAPNECFRKYEDAADSYRDHSDFLKNSPRYASLFQLDPLDYEGWAKGLKKAGYATNPRYPEIIIKLIEDYHLQDYTMIALGKLEAPTDGVASANLPEAKKEGAITSDAEQQVQQPTQPAGTGEAEYPFGEFRINDTRVVYIREGISMLSVANQYNIPLARLFEFNELAETETLPTAQLIFLQRKRKVGPNDFYVVKAGESLAGIAQTQGIRLESLLELNHLKASMQPAAGEKLYLREKAPGAPRLVQLSANASGSNQYL